MLGEGLSSAMGKDVHQSLMGCHVGYCCGWHHPARSLIMYMLLPMVIWCLIYNFCDGSTDPRYGLHHKHLGSCFNSPTG